MLESASFPTPRACVPAVPLDDALIASALATIHDDAVVLCPVDAFLGVGGYDIPVHEAGHAVVAHHLKLPLHSAAIATSDEGRQHGVVFLTKVSDDWDQRTHEEDLAVAAKTQEFDTWNWAGCTFACMYLAGRVAELLALGIVPDVNTLVTEESLDMVCAQRWAGVYRRNAVLLVCQRFAVDILHARWQSVLGIAALLRSRDSASSAEIEGLMQYTAAGAGAELDTAVPLPH